MAEDNVSSTNPVNTGDGEASSPAPSGKLMQGVRAFKEFMGVLRGGGVWAALAITLIVCAWLGVQLKASQDQIVEILMAVKMTEAPPATAVPTPTPVPATELPTKPATVPTLTPENPRWVNFNPKEVLGKYRKIYEPQVAQQMQQQQMQNKDKAVKF